MHPIICKIGPFSIYSYGLMLAVAFMASSLLVIQEAKRQRMAVEPIFNFSFTVFIFGIIGARMFYVIENINYYFKAPLEIIMLQRGGLSWFGGLLLGSISGIIYLRKKKLAVLKTLDLLIPYVAFGQAIGRIGCLLNGCCFGEPSGAGIYFTVHKATLIPTQAYSSLALLAIFVALRFLQRRPQPAGKIFFIYLLLYSIKRFTIEFWRADNAVAFYGLTFFQLVSIAVFCFAFLKLLFLKKIRA